MDEYISREEVIDEVIPLRSRFGAMDDWDRGYDTAIAEVVERIKRVPVTNIYSVDRWISVKDSVPEAGVNVLVTDGMHMMVTWCEYVDNQCLWVDNYYEYVNVRFKEVTHWMPLPEPPKDGDAE